MAYQLLGAVAIVVGLVGTWFAARSRRGWLLCIASTVLWLPALTTGDFNFGVKPSIPSPPYLQDFAAGVKITTTTGALVVFIR